MSASIRTFRNVRVRLHRRNSDKWLAGWVTHLARDEARVRLWSHIPFDVNEPVAGECYGQGTVARFNGKVFAQANLDIAVALNGSISYAPSEETPRIYASGLNGQLQGNKKSATLQVLDVSPLSLGVLTDCGFDSGDRLVMSLPTEMGPVAAQVSVANCREDPNAPGHYRIGLHIDDMARLDRARWGRLVAERAEA
ncbi:hypothetical protein EON82_03890 [bacterium]|nr:MAG: hypothetical protein EON82_03890 [bacterium]